MAPHLTFIELHKLSLEKKIFQGCMFSYLPKKKFGIDRVSMAAFCSVWLMHSSSSLKYSIAKTKKDAALTRCLSVAFTSLAS